MFVHRLSKFFIEENLSSETSSDGDLLVVDKDNLEYIDRMFLSESPVDRRFLRFYEVMNREIDSESIGHQQQQRRRVKSPAQNIIKKRSRIKHC